jgi:ubiquinone/menaquinone biosynthesis C-methylase UbiE
VTLGDFTQQSDAYRRSRPAYPAELLDVLIADAGLIKGDPVADFGAGTGIMTGLLVERGFFISAIEPNDAMRKQAEVPMARWLNGTFEESFLGDATQRWAVAAQAFHWADPPRCLPEIHRVLQERCLFTVLWNNRAKSDNEIVEWTENAIRRHVPEFDEAYRNRPWKEILESTGDFTFVNQTTVSHTIPMTRERYLELWKSHNRLNTIAGQDRFAAFFRELSEHLERLSLQPIDIRYDCEAWSARRND